MTTLYKQEYYHAKPFSLVYFVQFFVLLLGLFGSIHAQIYKYDFGSGSAASGYTKVLATTTYSSSQGYGFDQASGITTTSRGGSDVMRGDYCTSSKAFSFSVKLPLGNYAVTVYIGDISGTSTTTVYGEQRRLFIDRLSTSSGQVVAKSFTIHRRDNKNGSIVITQTSREPSYVDLDEKLTLQFSGSKPCICGIDIAKVDTAITLYLCGNSTVVDQPAEPYCGWGQMIPRLFTSKVCIADYAESGLRASDFFTQFRIDMILSIIKPGDYVFIEFGHNDQKDTTEVKNYAATLQKLSDAAISKNAIPVFVTPTARQYDYDSSKSIAGLAEVMRATAKSSNVKMIELNAKVLALKKVVNNNGSSMYVSGDSTHFTNYGAFELSRCVALGMKEINLDVAQYLNNDLPNFDPSKPDPTNYLTTATVGVQDNKPEYKITINGAHATSKIHVSENVVVYNDMHIGAADFVLYTSLGKKIAVKKSNIDKRDGSFSWDALQQAAPGVYIIQCIKNHSLNGMSRFCKL